MTLSTTDKTRFLQALRDDPEFLQQVRQHVLIADLFELPERFAAFASMVTAFIEQQQETNARVDAHLARVDARLDGTDARFDGIDARLDGIDARLDGVDARFDKVDARFDKVDARFDRIEARLQRMSDDIGDLKGHVAGRVAREMADDIAERFGFEMTTVLSGDDLRRMLRQHNPQDIDPGVRRSFYLADLVGKVIDQQGDEFFLAAEASYTADRRDTDRAIRNAEFLTRFTGMRAVPAIASRHNDRYVQQLVEAGTIRWFEFEQRDLSPQ